MDTTAVTTCTPLWWLMPTIASIALAVSVTAVFVAYNAIKTNRKLSEEKAIADRKTAKLKNTADMLMKWRSTPEIKHSFDVLRSIHNNHEECIEGLAKNGNHDDATLDKKTKIVFLLNFIEDIAACCRHDIYDIDLIESSLRSSILKSWSMSIPFVYKLREQQSTLYENIEWFIAEMNKPK